MAPFARTLLLYAPPTLASALAGFGGVYVFTRLLGPDGYGVYALVFAAAALTHTLALTWTEAIVYRFGARSHARPDGAAASGATVMRVFWRVWTPTACAIAGLGAALLVVLPLDPAVRTAGAFALAYLPIESLLNARRELMRARGEDVGYCVLETWRAGAGLALGVALVVWTPLGAAGPFAGALAAGAAALLVYARGLTTPTLGHGATGSPRRDLRRALRPGLTRIYAAYAAPLTCVLALNLVLSAGDRFLIAALLDARAVGVYAAAYGVADRTVLLIFSWAGLAAAPFILSAYEAQGAHAARAAVRTATRLLAGLGLPAAVGVAVCADPIARLLIAPDMAPEASQSMPWSAAGAFLNGLLLHVVARAFELSRRTGRQALLLAPAVLANLGLNLVLIPQFGLTGAAAATLVSYALALGLAALGARGPVTAGVPWADLGKIVAACALMALSVSAAPKPDAALPALLIAVPLGGLVYGLVIAGLDVGGVRTALGGWLRARGGKKETGRPVRA